MSRSRPTVHAAGALVWRRSRRTLQVLLVHRPRYDDWSWPKGKLDPGETLPACAVREVAEETGLQVVLGVPLPQVRYRVADGRLKACHYWAAQAADDGDPSLRARPAVTPCHPTEIDEARWVDVRTARKMLTRADDRAPLDALVDLWDEGALTTRTLVVVRHARARKRAAWNRGENTRPLTRAGATQAAALAPLLAAFGVRRLVSSPWRRCTATLEPYASSARLAVETRDELTEAAHKRSRSGVRGVVTQLVRAAAARAASPAGEGNPGGLAPSADGVIALCTHRPVLPTLVEVLEARSPSRVRKVLPSADPYLKPGEILVVHLWPRQRRKTRVIAVERHRP
ncbi:NUDIX hydrolase [Beutenbergia cavernae DSM 12333]|uniref:NUDIX hydrolase n=1 Tax=Beutenbergia cavernae (strain ATCC BAA-8 / DSM 12333 / CCUG 43141 / JCM 11478 / NBRC 16432 / NCIMB 13614 / HKI 0122) TaxID=471853 RepID=C5C244_BEUC1|nr:NUDIX hydrolase [Beutenbergia cavernae]ACQ81669.1 NUDIX hydrolase [Beutenbergia cavernae DSM 12333]